MTPRAKPISHALSVVAKHFRIEVDDLLRDERVDPLTGMRRIAMTVARHATGASYTEIAKVMQRDHSTIVSANQHLRAVAQKSEWLNTMVAGLILQVIEDLWPVNPPQLYRVSSLPSVQLSDTPAFNREWSHPQLNDLPSVQPAADTAVSTAPLGKRDDEVGQ